MKRLILCIIIMILISFMIVGCTEQDLPDGSSELPEMMNPQDQPDKQLTEFKGRLGKNVSPYARI